MFRILFFIYLLLVAHLSTGQRRAVFIILDGISADALENTETPFIDEISKKGGYTRAYTGGAKGTFSESPTVSAVGYNHVLTGTWSNKHNVWDNDIENPNYHYWNIFRIAKSYNPSLRTAIFSTWLDNRTRLIGEGLEVAGSIKLDYTFDGFELDENKFPHTADRKYILDIDEYVSTEAARYIQENGPDLSWVYLEYTDDMGHLHGDSPQYSDAIKKADEQVGKIWKAIQSREANTKEQWMIVITTDHGRDAETGKNHGGQSDRERTVWISTNSKPLNKRFGNQTASVDIMPSILRHMNIPIPENIENELDGVPFIGNISVADLKANRVNEKIHLTWKSYSAKGKAKIYISTSNDFGKGLTDHYVLVAQKRVSKGNFDLTIKNINTDFLKILLKAPHNSINTWVQLK